MIVQQHKDNTKQQRVLNLQKEKEVFGKISLLTVFVIQFPVWA